MFDRLAVMNYNILISKDTRGYFLHIIYRRQLYGSNN